MICTGQCHGCAYKPGAAANGESHNRLRAMFAALGGYPFMCHESLGWTPDRKGYPSGCAMEQRLSMLLMRPKLIDLGATPEKIAAETEALRRDLRLCAGWRASVARLKALGWFSHAGITRYRRQMGKLAARALDSFLAIGRIRVQDWRKELNPEDPLATAITLADAKAQARRDLKTYVNFLSRTRARRG